MINEIKQAIVNELAQLYTGYTIYDEDIPQNFKTPSFLITLIDQDYNKRINTKFRSSISFDIAYFSNKDVTEIRNDCYDIQIQLFREFDLIGEYRVLNKQAVITDKVLHFTCDINYSEIMDEAYIKMMQSEIIERTEV